MKHCIISCLSESILKEFITTEGTEKHGVFNLRKLVLRETPWLNSCIFDTSSYKNRVKKRPPSVILG
jgi:hypothetical protein